MSSGEGTPRVGSLDVSWTFAAGYLLTKGQASILYSRETTATESLWTLGRSAKALAAVFVEPSFPGRLEPLALQTGCLTPRLLIKHLDKLDKPEGPVKIFHMKPQSLEKISAELALCQRHCRILDGYERFVF